MKTLRVGSDCGFQTCTGCPFINICFSNSEDLKETNNKIRNEKAKAADNRLHRI